MNSKEFLKEAHEYIDEKYACLTNSRKVIMEMFKTFHFICQQNEINYFVAYGSLLAQVRDDGFIPWDSDFDVCVPIKDVKKLCEVLKKSLPKSMYIESNFNNSHYPYFQMRIGYEGYDINWLHLDIFYLIGAPGDETNELQKFQNRVIRLFIMRMNKAYYRELKKKNKKSKSDLLLQFVYGLRTILCSEKKLDKDFSKVTTLFNYDTAENVTVVCHVKSTFKKSIIEPVKLKNYHGIDMFVPNNEVSFLNHCYKNYKEYLPIQKRFDEFYQWVKLSDNVVVSEIDYRKL